MPTSCWREDFITTNYTISAFASTIRVALVGSAEPFEAIKLQNANIIDKLKIQMGFEQSYKMCVSRRVASGVVFQ